MSDINIRESHARPIPEAIEAVKSFEDQMSKYGVKTLWKGENAEIKGVGISGKIQVSSSEVVVNIKLGTLAKMAGVDPVRLEGSIRRRLRAGLDGE